MVVWSVVLRKPPKFNFSIVYFSKTWASDINVCKNSSFQLPNCNIEHQIIKSGKGGSVCIFFIHKPLHYDVRKDPFINCDAIEYLSIEICNRKTLNAMFNVVFRPHNNGDTKISEQFCKDLFSKNSEDLKKT